MFAFSKKVWIMIYAFYVSVTHSKNKCFLSQIISLIYISQFHTFGFNFNFVSKTYSQVYDIWCSQTYEILIFICLGFFGPENMSRLFLSNIWVICSGSYVCFLQTYGSYVCKQNNHFHTFGIFVLISYDSYVSEISNSDRVLDYLKWPSLVNRQEPCQWTHQNMR